MRNLVSTGLVLLLAVLLSVSSTVSSAGEPSNAKCAIPKFKDAFEQAGAVFVGKVLSKKTEGETKVFELEVERYWKGIEDKKVTVYVNESPRYQAQFEVGESYLVFAEKDEADGKFFDRRCSRTKPMGNDFGYLKEDLEKLGEAEICIGLGKK